MQAEHFMHSREKQILDVKQGMLNKPIILCPYDSELYGHWWYEGPHFIYSLFKKIYYDTTIFKCITPSEYIATYPNMQLSTPCRSSWGANGYSEVWLNNTNDYAHKHLLKLCDKMVECATLYKNVEDKLITRALNQMARELLLLQSSDWLFIITNGTMVEYAHKRIKDHTGYMIWLNLILYMNIILKTLSLKMISFQIYLLIHTYNLDIIVFSYSIPSLKV